MEMSDVCACCLLFAWETQISPDTAKDYFARRKRRLFRCTSHDKNLLLLMCHLGSASIINNYQQIF